MELYSVMVTGSNRGIGLEFVRQLAKLNPPPKHVFATYRDKNNIQELQSIQNSFHTITKIHLIKMDVTNENEINEAVQIVKNEVQKAGLTLLINNAATNYFQSFPKLTADVLNLHFATNSVAHLLVTQAFYPLLKLSAETQSGQNMSFSRAGVLNISSGAGSITDVGILPETDSFLIPYKISKAALNMGMRVIAADSKKDNIMVVMVCPGWVKTDLGSNSEVKQDTTELTRLGLSPMQPCESVSVMLDTISKLNETHSGNFIDRFGKPISF